MTLDWRTERPPGKSQRCATDTAGTLFGAIGLDGPNRPGRQARFDPAASCTNTPAVGDKLERALEVGIGVWGPLARVIPPGDRRPRRTGQSGTGLIRHKAVFNSIFRSRNGFRSHSAAPIVLIRPLALKKRDLAPCVFQIICKRNELCTLNRAGRAHLVPLVRPAVGAQTKTRKTACLSPPVPCKTKENYFFASLRMRKRGDRQAVSGKPFLANRFSCRLIWSPIQFKQTGR